MTLNAGARVERKSYRLQDSPLNTAVNTRVLHDDEFRFEVDLNTGGLESGEVHLSDRIVGPKIRCDLVAVGIGEKTPEGNPIVDYSGTCTFKR